MNLLPCIANPESTAHRSLVTTMMAAWIFIMLPLTASGQIEADFRTPPADTRPWVYWYFMDGNLSREGITADLEAMRDAGIGGAIFLEVDLGIPRGPVRFMSDEWQALFVHAVRESERLGIELVLGSGPGWCGTGGQWVTPGQSMQHLVASDTTVTGPMMFDGMLVRPAPRAPFFGEWTLTPELAKEWREFYRDVAVLAFPAPEGSRRIADVEGKALYQRAPYSSAPNVKPSLPVAETYPSVPAAECVSRSRIVDITSRMTENGRLTWDVPPGRWTIQRYGRTATGQVTRPAPVPGLGFETSKFDTGAIDMHFEHYVGSLLKKIGPRTGRAGGLNSLHFDSWEMSSQNWSEHFRGEFRKRRGYDPLPFLPAYTGRIVDNLETAERFLWDLRQTAQELVIENHITRLRDLAHRNGLTFSLEPYDMNPNADLSLGAVADVPMGEFWWLGFNTKFSIIEAASIAHTCGRSIVGAEAGIRFYSGIARYRKTFTLVDDPRWQLPSARIYLDLGMVKNMARVRLNGRDLGMVWCSPWRVDITDAVKHGRNDLEIEVSNLWVNRLIGDADLPPAKQISWTTLNPYKANSQLMESGLLGPVSIQSAVSPKKN